MTVILMWVGAICFSPRGREQGLSPIIGIAAENLTDSGHVKQLGTTQLVCIGDTESEPSLAPECTPSHQPQLLRTEAAEETRQNCEAVSASFLNLNLLWACSTYHFIFLQEDFGISNSKNES